jgi:L-asparaginase II
MDDPHQHTEHGYLPLYHTIRGGTVESIHYGAIAVVDSSGNLIASYGNPSTISFLRSSAKPLQAISFIEQGGIERFQMTGKEIAVICSSHSGTDHHLKTIYGLQKKIGVSESDLGCCTHLPFDPASRAKLRDQGLNPNQNHHNCSGKHTGMLALGKLMDYAIEGYTEQDHPIQKNILPVVADMCGLETNHIQLGRDGCSVPAFAMPLLNAALGWAKLVDPVNLSGSRKTACQAITQAMMEHPFYVAGPGRFDTRLMEIGGGKLVSKTGAEAFHALGILPGTIKTGSPGLGIVVKIADGDMGKRARKAVMLEILHQLNVLSTQQLSDLGDLGPVQEILNQCQIVVGKGKPCFQLQYS